MDFIYNSTESAAAVANEQTSYYGSLYDGITQEQYYNNPNVANGAQLYYTADGQFDYDTMYNEFLEKNLSEYAAEYFTPILKEKEKQIEQKLLELQTLGEAMNAELQTLDGSISNQIQSNTIKLV